MAKLEILTLPHPFLRHKAAPVKAVDDSVRQLMDDMLDTMYAAPGIGLAATQVGVDKRVIVLDVADKEDAPPAPLALANPEVVATTEDVGVYEEGCLSLPGIYAEVERPYGCTVKALDRDGKEVTIEAEGLLATCLQHEIDHLNGVLFVDYLSRTKRAMLLKKLKKLLNKPAAPPHHAEHDI